jgi:hypothetical protein
MRAALCCVFLLLFTGTAFCDPISRGPFGCDQGKPCPPPRWEKVEAANGSIYYADTATITPSNLIAGGQAILIYRDDGSEPDFGNTGWFTFDCDRPLVLAKKIGARPEYVPPRSVFGSIREIACGRSTPTKSLAPNSTSTDTQNLREALQKIQEAMKDPEKVRTFECMGIRIYKDPQPPGHPPSPDECKNILARHGISGTTSLH